MHSFKPGCPRLVLIRHWQWHPSRPVIATVSDLGNIALWSLPSTERWAAYAPGFEELQENQEYIEAEDEFDVVDAAVLDKRKQDEQESFADILGDEDPLDMIVDDDGEETDPELRDDDDLDEDFVPVKYVDSFMSLPRDVLTSLAQGRQRSAWLRRLHRSRRTCIKVHPHQRVCRPNGARHEWRFGQCGSACQEVRSANRDIYNTLTFEYWSASNRGGSVAEGYSRDRGAGTPTNSKAEGVKTHIPEDWTTHSVADRSVFWGLAYR